MKTLDLHRKRHHEAERLVENFILLSDLPAVIICGNSIKMQEITIEKIKECNLKYRARNFTDYSSIIVYE